MLYEVYYWGGLEPELVRRVRDRAERVLEALHQSRLWADLAAIPSSQVLLIDRLTAVRVEGILTWAAPDLIYDPGDSLVLVEWKSGAGGGTAEQLEVYSVVARLLLGHRAEGRALVGRSILLNDGRDETRSIDETAVAAGLDLIRASVAEMRARLSDPVANIPLPRDAYPMTGSWRACQRCPFLELCAPELGLGSGRRPQPEMEPGA